MLRPVFWFILADVSDELTASIIRVVMEAVSSFETSVRICLAIRLNIPVDSHFDCIIPHHSVHRDALHFEWFLKC
jgi:hypothetical protein